ncbi:MAG: indolepyruvate oxidoreductase subunit beta family protein [Pseudomonadota bacterium]
MNIHVGGSAAPELASTMDGCIKIAIMALGGQGGGVVTQWIIKLAEAAGYVAQSTSVPGVAQRTGATIYYIEMVPRSDREPIFSLMPAAGDVDIVLAGELMEAGRAVQRGFVTPDRTTLIASTHRAYAVVEKIAPGSGILDDKPILDAAHEAAMHFHCADFNRLALTNGSVISASLFGALGGSGVLPFKRDAFEATIRASGKGVSASLKAFAAGYDAVRGDPSSIKPSPKDGSKERAEHRPLGPPVQEEAYDVLLKRIEELPPQAQEMARLGLRKVVDFQDLRYGEEYLDRVEATSGRAPFHGDLAASAAKYIANALAYDDVIRVADLKTRSTRITRVRNEVGASGDLVLNVTEYMHPRGTEIIGLLPASLGGFIEGRPRLARLVDRLVNRGRRVRTDRLRGFLPLYVIASLRPIRRRLLRHRIEIAHVDGWLKTAMRVAATDPQLASEVLACRRLIKGYSDTHARGLSKFDRVLAALPLLEVRNDGADWLRRLREAALMDEAGTALEGALKTVASLDAPVKAAAE